MIIVTSFSATITVSCVAHFSCSNSDHNNQTFRNNRSVLKLPFRGGGSMKIFLIGFMGSGKTHWGRLLSEKLKLPFFDLDEQIVFAEKKSINEIFAEKGEEYFRMKEKELLHAHY